MADELLKLICLIVAGKTAEVRRILDGAPSLAVAAASVGASRQNPQSFFFPTIGHYVYQGDTALHMAAAANRPEIMALLLARKADVHAKNRLGATPLHYAADGSRRNPAAQAETIRTLIAAGADPNAINRLGVAPLHRAVRTRSSAAVKALLAGGADPNQTNRSGSTPLFLAQRTTGKSGSGTERARAEQVKILRLLRQANAGS